VEGVELKKSAKPGRLNSETIEVPARCTVARRKRRPAAPAAKPI
jgi:hypothetical protein